MSARTQRAGVARLLAVALVCVLAVVLLGAAGCAAKPAQQTEANKVAQCAQNQARIRQMMDLFYADSQTFPPIATVVEKLGIKCPDGGTYVFDEKTETVSCSVHGHLSPSTQ